MSESAESKAQLAAYLRAVIGGEPRVFRYWDEGRQSHIDIMSAVDRPEHGVTTFVTLGLSDYSIGLNLDHVPLRLEILFTAASLFDHSGEILSTCAFNIINSHFKCKPWTIFKDVVHMYRSQSPMRHIMFVDPFLWDIESQEFPNKYVAWLHAIPISEDERAFSNRMGAEALIRLFETHQIDVFDMDRPSIC